MAPPIASRTGPSTYAESSRSTAASQDGPSQIAGDGSCSAGISARVRSPRLTVVRIRTKACPRPTTRASRTKAAPSPRLLERRRLQTDRRLPGSERSADSSATSSTTSSLHPRPPGSASGSRAHPTTPPSATRPRISSSTSGPNTAPTERSSIPCSSPPDSGSSTRSSGGRCTRATPAPSAA